METSGDLTESLQLQALALSVKALIATHPNPQALRLAMQDLFAQFQATPIYHRLSDDQRAMSKYFFEQSIASLPDSAQ